MKKQLILVTGLPGSGKTTVTQMLLPTVRKVATDDYWELHSMKFDASRLSEAHAWCRERVRGFMRASAEAIAVHNTFTAAWEADPYFELAAEYGYGVLVLECRNTLGSEHAVSEALMEHMRTLQEPFRSDGRKVIARRRWASNPYG